MAWSRLRCGLVAAVSLWAIALSSVVREAAAQAGPLVHVAFERCESFDEVEARRVLAAELGTELVTWNGAGVTTIELRCQGTFVRIRVQDPVTRKLVSRELALHDVSPRSQARLVALAAAELVLASWAELELPGRGGLEPVGAPPPVGVVNAAQEIVRNELAREEEPVRSPRAPRAERRRLPQPTRQRMLVLGSVRGFVTQGGVLGGAGVRFGQERTFAFSWAVDGLFEGGSLDTQSTSTDVLSTTIGGQIYYGFPSRFVTWRAGAGLRLGIVRVERHTDPASISTEVAPWGWPMLATSFTLHPGHLALELSGESGYTLLPERASRARGEALEGIWFSGQVGLGWRW